MNELEKKFNKLAEKNNTIILILAVVLSLFICALNPDPAIQKRLRQIEEKLTKLNI